MTPLSLIRSTLLACAASLAAFAVQAGTLDEIRERGTIRVGVPSDSPPFGMKAPDGGLVGYDVEMAQLIADDLGVALEITNAVGSNRVPLLTSGRVDIVISSFGKNEERDKVIDFSDQYAPFYNGVFGPADIEVNGPEDLKGYSVGVTTGTIEDLELSAKTGDDVTITRFESGASGFSAYFSGAVDFFATGNVTAAALMENPNLPREIVPKFLINSSPCYIGVREGDTQMLEYLNGFIAEVKADGRLNEISVRWMKTDLPEGF
ncbi:transporter substrate-binding domain-containing protein [Ponticoccus alexandrii]|uniref:Transporter substrate-binding domain-containing protein n=1 Tax=Ponticoccus alexandrii TaxID=1943633 RepID=A0ABX7F8X0_9RHOB|nr:transporter substrate-binding domain-containing protein [Ponticoccus alexandrii]ETA51717.1 amino acid ABC transporter substrate-binding protein [Rhodobacteraceae bacterium PD-2]QRF66569.1 transporter substrate-binding domain-containing protein [Ponticoccus alexandrii]